MRWESCGPEGRWREAITPAGTWAIEPKGEARRLCWYPPGLSEPAIIGDYRTEGAAKGAAKRYAKKLGAAFKAMGKAGWQ